MISNFISDLLWNWCNYLMPSLIFSIVATSLLWCFQKYGWKVIMKQVLETIKKEQKWKFRFLFLMYSYFILDRTLLSRHFAWTNGIKNVMSGWALYDSESGEVTFEAVENFMFFIPFIILFFLAFTKEIKLIKCIKKSLIMGAGLSMFIEMNQLFFKVGEFQIADLVYNIGGALLGGILYWIFENFKLRKKESIE